MNELEILLSTNMTEYDAKRHIKQGVTIYEVKEYLDSFNEYTEGLEDDDKEKLKAFLTTGKDGSIWDNDLTTYNGVKYYIEYTL